MTSHSIGVTLAKVIGFRLYECKISEKNKRFVLSDEQAIKADYELIDYVESLLNEMYLNHAVCTGSSRTKGLSVEEYTRKNPENGDVCFILLEHKRKNNVIQIKVSYGKYGDRDFLVHSNGSSLDIRDKAPTKNFYIRLAFPPQQNTFYMVAEVHGRSQAGTELLERLTQYDYARHEFFAENGVTQTPWYRFRVTPLMDQQRLDDLVDNSEACSLSLKAHKIDAKGQREVDTLEINLSIESKVKQRVVQRQLLDWVRRFGRGEKITRQESAKEIVALLPTGTLSDSFECENGEIEIIENGKRTTISSDNLDRLFIYPVKAEDYGEIWSKAAQRLDIIAEAFKVDIPDIDVFDN